VLNSVMGVSMPNHALHGNQTAVHNFGVLRTLPQNCSPPSGPMSYFVRIFCIAPCSYSRFEQVENLLLSENIANQVWIGAVPARESGKSLVL